MADDCLGRVARDVFSPTTNPSKPLKSNSSKRKPSSDPSYFSHPSTFLSSRRSIASPSTKRSLSTAQSDNTYMELHQSTCLNLNSSDNSDSDLWILPDFEDWEYDDASPLAHPASTNLSVNFSSKRDRDGQSKTGMASQSEWAPLVQRAATSNRERLRRRLEGDGWDFVGGKYGQGGQGEEEWRINACGSEESVDEEFDVVVLLPSIAVS